MYPSIEYEEHEWEPSPLASKTQLRKQRGPYRSAITPPIADLTIEIDSELAAEAARAEGEIVRFDRDYGRDLAGFGPLLLRSEAAASSQIEQLTSSARSVLLAEAGAARSLTSNASVIAANTAAMRAAIDAAGELDAAAILEIQATLLGATRPEFTGKWRDTQVWIGIGRSPHSADFVPPHHHRVPGAIEDLVAFIARTDIQPLVHAAIAHAQFETIHPFPDGNGRTGRAIVHAMLGDSLATEYADPPISAGLLAQTSRYFDALTAFREGEPAPIIEAFIDAADAAIINATQLALDIADTASGWNDELADLRSHATARVLLGHLVGRPVLSAATVVDLLGVSHKAALAGLGLLEQRGIVSRHDVQRRRDQVWVAHDITRHLDEFAERAGRRVLG